MSRLLIGAAFGLVVGVVAGAAVGLHAEDTSRDVKDVAAAAGYDEQELAGAVVSTGVDPYTYARWEGRLAPLPKPPPKLTVPSVQNARVACIEAKESGGANVPNARGSGAVGVMQYMVSTFRAHAAEMARETGDPSVLQWSPWNPSQARALAAWDLAKGRRSQWTVSGC